MAKKPPVRYDIKSVSFTEVEKAEYSAWIEGRSIDILDVLTTFVEGGLKASISTDKYSEAPLLSLTFPPTHKNIKSTVFLLKHAQLDKLLSIGLFYYVEILDHGEAKPADEDDLDW